MSVKTKHRFNWVDALIILAVIIVGIGVFWRMTGQVQGATSTSATFTYTVEVKEVRQMTVDAMQKSVGMKFNMNDKARVDDMGTLLSADVSPAMRPLAKANGDMVLAAVPERFDMVLTFQLNGQVNDLGYYTPQLSNIGAGASVIIRSKYVQVNGSIGKVNSANN